MKVKKLEWYQIEDKNEYEAIIPDMAIKFKVFYNESDKDYLPRIITHITPKGLLLVHPVKTLEKAKQACQDHYESFILSQIENDHVMVKHDIAKPFDPSLIGFDLPEKINDDLVIYTRRDDLGIFQLCKATTKSHSEYYWFLTFKDSSISGFPDNESEPILKGVVIDNHDFGSKLISQFLGEKTDGN